MQSKSGFAFGTATRTDIIYCYCMCRVVRVHSLISEGPMSGQTEAQDSDSENQVLGAAAGVAGIAESAESRDADAEQNPTGLNAPAPGASTASAGLSIGARAARKRLRRSPCVLCGTPTDMRPGQITAICARDRGRQRSFHDEAARAGKLDDLLEVMREHPETYFEIFRDWLAQRLGWVGWLDSVRVVLRLRCCVIAWMNA